ncbi:MAG: hypothetical protein ABL977_14370 [Candidatus Eisenbacteria bacterium]
MAFLLDTTASVPGLTRRAFERSAANLDGLDWQRIAVLYEAGPDFGTAPTWWSDPRERTLHTLRGMAATIPDARLQLRLARAEMQGLDLPRTQAAWRTAWRIDPAGVGAWMARYRGDTLRAVADGPP